MGKGEGARWTNSKNTYHGHISISVLKKIPSENWTTVLVTKFSDEFISILDVVWFHSSDGENIGRVTYPYYSLRLRLAERRAPLTGVGARYILCDS